MEKFKLKIPSDECVNKQPVIRLKSAYYQTLCVLKAKTGLPLGNIALEHMDRRDLNA